MQDVRERHIQDSLQIAKHVDFAQTWLDMGSGGGLPGIVLAIFAKTNGIPTKFTLVESDQRKSTFLQTAALEFDLNVQVVPKRIEDHDQPMVDHI